MLQVNIVKIQFIMNILETIFFSSPENLKKNGNMANGN